MKPTTRCCPVSRFSSILKWRNSTVCVCAGSGGSAGFSRPCVRGPSTAAVQRSCFSRTCVRYAVSGVASMASFQPRSPNRSASASRASRISASNSGCSARQRMIVRSEGMAGSSAIVLSISPCDTRATTSSAVAAQKPRPLTALRGAIALARSKTRPNPGCRSAQRFSAARDGIAGSAQTDTWLSPAATRRQTSRATVAENRT